MPGAERKVCHLTQLVLRTSQCGAIPNQPFWILPGGILEPTAYTSPTGGCVFPQTDTNIDDAQNAIAQAEIENVPAAVLGVAVHPYHYNTEANQGYWLNDYGTASGGAGRYGTIGYSGICGDLAQMINIWTATFPIMPLVFTEDDWAAQPSLEKTSCADPETGCEGTYLVDLFTWLSDHHLAGANSPLRLAWVRGTDDPVGVPLGIYQTDGTTKTFWTDVCPTNPSVAGNHSIANDYAWGENGADWGGVKMGPTTRPAQSGITRPHSPMPPSA